MPSSAPPPIALVDVESIPAPASPAATSDAASHGWTLGAVAEELAGALRERDEKVAVSEVTSGGVLAASLLSLPGASSFFTGGVVAYSPGAREALTPGCDEALKALEARRGASNYADPTAYRQSRVAWALAAARDLQLMCGADWGIAEVGAAGPSFHPESGHDSGVTYVAVVGPPRKRRADEGDDEDPEDSEDAAWDRVWVRRFETGHARREENMWQFAAAAASMCARCMTDENGLDDARRLGVDLEGRVG